MLQSAGSRLLVSAAKSVAQKRCSSAVATPPNNYISPAEKYILGGLMCASFLVIPAWVLSNIKVYRAEK